MLRSWTTLALFWPLCFTTAERTVAAPPIVESVVPGVGARGGEFSVTLSGGRLQGALGLLFYGEGLSCKSVEAVSDNELKATLAAAADCPLGAHPFRLQTPGGLSEIKVVHISPFPVTAEVEPNDAVGKATAVGMNATISGVIDSGDVDFFVVALRKGATLSAEVQAIRLGGEMTDAVLTVIGPDGTKIAEVDDTDMTHQDPFVTFVAPRDGRYTLQIRDTAYGGGASSTYAFHVGDFPRPSTIFPPGGQAGETVRFRQSGAEREAASQVVKLSADAGPWWDYYPRLEGAAAPTPTRVRVRPYPCVEESDAADANKPRDWPVAFHGVLARHGEVDVFAVNARAGDSLRVEVYAERIGSPLDSILEISDPEGNPVGRCDDDACHDSAIEFRAMTSGAYRIAIFNKKREGGSAFVYRIEIEQPRPSLELFLPGLVRKSQGRQAIAVPRGNRVTAYLGVRRDGFDAPVHLEASGLPRGVSFDMDDIPASGYLTPIVIEAAADAPLGAAFVSLKGKSTGTGGGIEGGFKQTVDLLPATGDTSYESVTVDRLAVVVTEEAPYSVSLSQPRAPLAQDGAIELVATVERAKGYEEAVEVTFPFLPPGVEMEGPIVLAATESRAIFRLSARPDADPASWRLAAEVKTAPPRRDRRAMTIALQNTIDPNAGGTGGKRRRVPIEAAAEVASRFVPLELSKSSLSGRFEPAIVEQGGAVEVCLDLETSSPPSGPLEATLEGLPPRATAKPVVTTPGQRRLSFPVTISTTTPIGEHDTLICRLTGAVDGQTLVYQVGRGGLLKVVAPGSLTLDANGKPLSPLEALRRKERAQSSIKEGR